MTDGFLFSYSDIVFAPEHARRVAAAPGAVALVDRSALARRLRRPHAAPGERGRAGARRGRRRRRRASPASASGWSPAEEAAGEFIGLARFSAEGAAALARRLARGRARAAGRAVRRRRDAAPGLPQRRAQRARRARRGAARRCFIDGRWREIDTEEDLARAETTIVDDLGTERAMPGPDPAHWLHRLTADEWLAAAATELGPRRGSARRGAPFRPASRTRAARPGWPGTPC